MKIVLIALMLITAVVMGCKKRSNNHSPDEPIKDEQVVFPVATRFASMNCPRSTNKIDTVKAMMQGTYEWAYTFFRAWRQPAEIWTPQNKSLTYRYVFKANGEVEYYENKRLKWVSDYVVDYELAVSGYYLDSAAMVIIKNKQEQRLEYFRAYICNDSAVFYNPMSSFDVIRHFSRR